jgi:hypothetical protein
MATSSINPVKQSSNSVTIIRDKYGSVVGRQRGTGVSVSLSEGQTAETVSSDKARNYKIDLRSVYERRSVGQQLESAPQTAETTQALQDLRSGSDVQTIVDNYNIQFKSRTSQTESGGFSSESRRPFLDQSEPIASAVGGGTLSYSPIIDMAKLTKNKNEQPAFQTLSEQEKTSGIMEEASERVGATFREKQQKQSQPWSEEYKTPGYFSVAELNRLNKVPKESVQIYGATGSVRTTAVTGGIGAGLLAGGLALTPLVPPVGAVLTVSGYLAGGYAVSSAGADAYYTTQVLRQPSQVREEIIQNGQTLKQLTGITSQRVYEENKVGNFISQLTLAELRTGSGVLADPFTSKTIGRTQQIYEEEVGKTSLSPQTQEFLKQTRGSREAVREFGDIATGGVTETWARTILSKSGAIVGLTSKSVGRRLSLKVAGTVLAGSGAESTFQYFRSAELTNNKVTGSELASTVALSSVSSVAGSFAPNIVSKVSKGKLKGRVVEEATNFAFGLDENLVDWALDATQLANRKGNIKILTNLNPVSTIGKTKSGVYVGSFSAQTTSKARKTTVFQTIGVSDLFGELGRSSSKQSQSSSTKLSNNIGLGLPIDILQNPYNRQTTKQGQKEQESLKEQFKEFTQSRVSLLTSDNVGFPAFLPPMGGGGGWGSWGRTRGNKRTKKSSTSSLSSAIAGLKLPSMKDISGLGFR